MTLLSIIYTKAKEARKTTYMLPFALNTELKGDSNSSSHIPSSLVSVEGNGSESGWNIGKFQ